MQATVQLIGIIGRCKDDIVLMGVDRVWKGTPRYDATMLSPDA
jgi:hypothetical protein